MGTRGRDRSAEPAPDAVLDVFGAPLLDALDADAVGTRRTSARALCSLATSDRPLTESLAGTVVDRLREADHQRAFVRTLATLADDDGDGVERALRSRDAPARLSRAVAAVDPWSFEQPTADGGAVDALVRQVVDVDLPATETPESPTVRERSTDDGRSHEASGTPSQSADDGPDPAARRRRERIERIESSRAFRAIELLGSFEELTVVEPEQAVRYGSAVRTRAETAEGTRGVAVRLFDRADPGDERRRFAAAVAERLACWDGLDHEAVLSIHDWGETPRPWVATPCVEGSLADRGRPPIARALRESIHLARGLEHCHARGVVHAGIDPETVVYPDASLDGLPAPRLDNVGLLTEFRKAFDPAQYLDPRYAAPEYFSQRYGAVDQATDVYQLGATCFRLCTGRSPYTGDYDAVRESVLDDAPPLPSAAADLPTALDPVFAKALAKDKLTRYETVTALRAELERALREIQ